MRVSYIVAKRVLLVTFGLMVALTLHAGTDSYKNSKQYKRFEWFWEARHTLDGGYPTARHYATETQRIERRKLDADVQATPDWVELGPVAPDGIPGGWQGIGRVNCLAISMQNADLMFLGSAHGGIWKSADAGANWTPVNVSGLPTFGVSDIAFAASDESILYAATGDADGTHMGSVANGGFSFGILKSVDGGTTWTPTALNYGADGGVLISRLWVDPRNPSILIAATSLGIQRTTDGGASWGFVSPPGNYRDLIGNPLAPDVLNATTFVGGGGATFYRSTDNGVKWTEVEPLPKADRIRLAVTKANINIVMAVASLGVDGGLEGVYVSHDGGQNYDGIQVPQNLLGYSSKGDELGGNGWYDIAAAISPTDTTDLFVGGVNIWRTLNGGANWSLAAHWWGDGAPWVHADQHFFKFHPSRNILYACHDGGIAQSTDNGASWKDISKGLRIQQYYALAVSNINTKLTMAGAQDNSTMLTTDGLAFRHVLGGDGMDNAIDPNDPKVLYGSTQNGYFNRSENWGGTWEFIASPDSLGDAGGAWVSPIVVHPTTSGTLYIGYSHVYKSTDYGATWSALSPDQGDGYFRHLAIAPSNADYIYAATSSALHFSTDGGTTWDTQDGISTGYIQDVAVHPSNPLLYWVTYGGFQGNLKIVEVNNGIVTNITGNGLANVPCNTVRYVSGNPGRIFVGTDIGVFTKPVDGGTWSPYGNGMPTTIVTDMEYIEPTRTLRICTFGRGVWEVPLALCTAVAPAISSRSGTTNVCLGDTIVLEAPPGYVKYRWSDGTMGRTLELVNSSQAGIYWVDVEDASGCNALSDTLSVQIRVRPTRPVISRKGDTLQSTALFAISFQWYRNNVAIADATSRTHIITGDGRYTVETINVLGCKSQMSDALDSPTDVSDEAPTSYSIMVHPNPAELQTTIHLPLATGRSLELLDVRGLIVAQQTIDDANLTCTISLESLSSGTYYLRIQAGNSIWMAVIVRL